MTLRTKHRSGDRKKQSLLTLQRRSVGKRTSEVLPEVTAVQWARISTAIEVYYHETERLLEWYEVARECLTDEERLTLKEEYPDSFPAEWRRWKYESSTGNGATSAELSCGEYLDAAVAFVESHFNPPSDGKNDPLSSHRENYTLFYVGCEWFQENSEFDSSKPEDPVKNPKGFVQRCESCKNQRICEDILSFEEDHIPISLRDRVERNAKPVVMQLFRINSILLNWTKNNESIRTQTENFLQDELEMQIKNMYNTYRQHDILPKDLLNEEDFYGLKKFIV